MVYNTAHVSIQKGRLLIVITAAFLCSVASVRAEEIVISANGSDSASSVSVSQNQETTVSQSNESSINNSVSTAQNTGSNSTSGNTQGTVTVSSGDVHSSTSISNAGNSSTVQTGCCPTPPATVTVSENGSGSNNTVSSGTTSTTTVTIFNSAMITNTLSGTAVTGRNTADNNNGNVSIKSGNITIIEQIKNGPLNINDVSVQSNGAGGYSAVITGNGSNSKNSITFSQENVQNIITHNISRIFNTVSHDLDTGGNSANNNVGSVDIATGDITTVTVIENGPLNVNKVTVDCCEKEKEKPTPTTGGVTPPPSPSQEKPQDHSTGNGGGGPSSGTGGPMFAAAGNLLPKTGGNWTLLFLFANMMMLFLGIFIRLRSGRSPAYAVVSR